MESALSISSKFTGTPVQYNSETNDAIEHNRINNPNWQEAASWLFTSKAYNLNSGQPRTHPVSGQSRTRTRDHRIASPRW